MTQASDSQADAHGRAIAEKRRDLETRTRNFQVVSVADAESFELGARNLRELKTLEDDVEETEKSATRPMLQALNTVRGWFKPMREHLKRAETAQRANLARYKTEQDRLEREQRHKAEEIARKEREELDRKAAEAEAKGRHGRAEVLRERAEAVVAAPPPPSEAPKAAGLANRVVWKFEIVDRSVIPDEFYVIDEKRIADRVKSLKGDTNIPGVRVWNEADFSARRVR
jgi:hypothetical protein